jgi:redox-sensitive bicupin YhaK (pirin superfamily)
MNIRSLQQQIKAIAVSEGAGVTVYRTLGTPALKNLDPFLLLDHFGSDNPDEYIAGFPDHPHRGFVTLTYMLDGHMEHRDSMGNRGDLRAGGAQWMKAASGVIHSEMPQQTNGLMRGFQLWINLPASAKMSEPAYQEFTSDAIPEVVTAGQRVRLLAGEYAGQRGAIDDPLTDLHYLDVTLAPQQTFAMPLPLAQRALVYVYEGDAYIGESYIGAVELPQHSLNVLGQGDEVQVSSGEAEVRFILVAGRPIGEPIVQHGPFVMNTRAETDQAMQDYRSGKLVRAKATINPQG